MFTPLKTALCLAAFGLMPGAYAATIDVAAAFAQRDYMTSSWSDAGQIPWLDSKGIVLVRGGGRLAGTKVVEVDLPWHAYLSAAAPYRHSSHRASADY